MYKIVAAHVEGEGRREGEISRGAGVQVELKDSGGVSDHGFYFDGVDEGFRESSFFEWGEVETVDVAPDWIFIYKYTNFK